MSNRVIWICLFLSIIALGIGTSRLQFDSDLSSFFPDEGATEALEKSGNTNRIFVIIENINNDEQYADPYTLIDAAEELKETVESRLEKDSLNIILYTEDLPDFSADLNNHEQLLKLSDCTGIFWVDGCLMDSTLHKMVVFIDMNESFTKANNSKETIVELARIMQECATPNVKIFAYGAPIVTITNTTCVQNDLIFCGITTILLISLLIVVSFRDRMRTTLLILLPVLFGILFALGIIGLIGLKISLIALGTGSIVMGIALSYSIHMLTHGEHCSSAKELVNEMAFPMTVGSITTFGAFIGLCFTQSMVLRHFGIFSSLTLIGTLLFSIFVLPQIMRFTTGSSVSAQRPFMSWLRRIASKDYSHNHWSVCAVIILTLIGLPFFMNVEFENNMNILNYEGDEWLQSSKAHIEALIEAYEDFGDVDSNTPDIGFYVQRAISSIVDDFNDTLLISSAIVALALIISYRNLKHFIVAFLPMCLSWVIILGFMAIAGIKFNPVTIILSTFIFGVGDDFAIFILDGLRSRDDKTNRDMLPSHQTAIAISGISRVICLGIQAMAKHPAIQSVGSIGLCGLVTGILTACIIEPAIYRFLNRWTFRTLARSIITYGTFCIGCLFCNVVLLFIGLIPMKSDRRHNIISSHVHRFMKGFYGLIGWLVPITITSRDKTKIENEPCIVIANHSSFIDIIAMMALFPKSLFVTKNWVAKSPLFGKLTRHLGFYNVDTKGGKEMADSLKKEIEAGYNIIIFPEGTRSVDGRVGRFYIGAFQLSQFLNVPIQPIAMRGNHKVVSKRDPLHVNKYPIENIFLPRFSVNKDDSVISVTREMENQIRRIVEAE